MIYWLLLIQFSLIVYLGWRLRRLEKLVIFMHKTMYNADKLREYQQLGADMRALKGFNESPYKSD